MAASLQFSTDLACALRRATPENRLRVRNFRAERGIPIYREGERAERGELILHEAATQLDVSKMTIIRLIKDNVLPAKQSCPGSPSRLAGGP